MYLLIINYRSFIKLNLSAKDYLNYWQFKYFPSKVSRKLSNTVSLKIGNFTLLV